MDKGLFISYRRDDTQSATARLAEHLAQNGFGEKGDMFLDVDHIAPGKDFRVVITETLERCDLVIVVIGRRWLGKDENGNRRIDSKSDTHRLEIAAALKSDSAVFPVLVEGAPQPSEEDLPNSLSDLAHLQSWRLGERNYSTDVKLLAEHLLDARREVAAHRARKSKEERERPRQATVVGKTLKWDRSSVGGSEASEVEPTSENGIDWGWLEPILLFVIPAIVIFFAVLTPIAYALGWESYTEDVPIENWGDVAETIAGSIMIAGISYGLGSTFFDEE